MGKTVIYEKKDKIGIIKLNRPEVLNAINDALIEDFLSVFQFSQKDDTRVIILKGEGRAFRRFGNIPFRNTTQPGYSAKRYFECMEKAQVDISAYGLEQFKALEPDIPITRIYDKLTFVTGKYSESGELL